MCSNAFSDNCFTSIQEAPKQDTKPDGDKNDIAEMAKSLKVWDCMWGLYVYSRGCVRVFF